MRRDSRNEKIPRRREEARRECGRQRGNGSEGALAAEKIKVNYFPSTSTCFHRARGRSVSVKMSRWYRNLTRSPAAGRNSALSERASRPLVNYPPLPLLGSFYFRDTGYVPD